MITYINNIHEKLYQGIEWPDHEAAKVSGAYKESFEDLRKCSQ